jgi:AraC-like DNA-binding protein
MENSTNSQNLSIHLCGYGFEDPALLDSKLHFHPFCQMNLVCGGRGYFKTSNGTVELHPGDIVLVPPGIHHALHLEKDCGFCDYSFKFFLRDDSLLNTERVIFSPAEMRDQQLVWINALGDIFKSIVPPELIKKPVEFPLSPDTPGAELLSSMLYGFCRRICGNEKNQDSWVLNRIKLLVQSRKGKALSVAECARHLNCSAGHLRFLVRKECGFSTKEFIDRERIHIARELLIWSNAPVTLLAEKMGFKDLIYFDRFFRKYTGETPRSYRKRNRRKV